MLLATSKNFTHLIVIRFFVGLAEATFYPAIQYVIGSWYKPEELAKRACLFHVNQQEHRITLLADESFRRQAPSDLCSAVFCKL